MKVVIAQLLVQGRRIFFVDFIFESAYTGLRLKVVHYGSC